MADAIDDYVAEDPRELVQLYDNETAGATDNLNRLIGARGDVVSGLAAINANVDIPQSVKDAAQARAVALRDAIIAFANSL